MQKLSNSNSSVSSSFNTLRSSDATYSDASFIRFKNLSISYHLPERWSKSLTVNSLKIYLQAQNLLTITNYKGGDPEIQSPTGIAPLKVFVMGAQIAL